MQPVYISVVLFAVACLLGAVGYYRTHPKEKPSSDPWKNNDSF